MAQTPTSKAQVQAYRFVLKRIESALVRRDAVMLHDPMRTHLRAATVGVILAVIGAAGFFMFGLIKPKTSLDQDGIVIGKPSGSYYVFDHDPVSRLIPVTNLASARLIMISLGSGQGDMTPKFVDDSALAGFTRTSLAGIPGAPLYIPGEKERVAPKWSVCDRTVPDSAKPEQQREAQAAITTTAVIGYDRIGHPLGDAETLLVASSHGEHYLIFDGKRARIDLSKNEIRRAFNLEDATPRVISSGLLNAIPSVDDLRSPTIAGRGQNSPLPLGGKVGEVVQIIRPGLEPYSVLLRDGYQEIPTAVADLIRFTPGYPGPGRIRQLRPADLNNLKNIENGLDVNTSDFPRDIARPVPLADSTLACLYWAYDRDGDRQSFTVTIADDLRVPGAPQPVKLAQSDGSGDRLDQVLIAAGKGAAVQGTVPAGQARGTGEIWLVTDQGVRYPVPNTDIAAALGMGTQFDPAPQAIMNILPIGPALDPAQAIRTYDTIDTGDQGSSLDKPGR